jgi:hypothetical protein
LSRFLTTMTLKKTTERVGGVAQVVEYLLVSMMP